MRSRQRKIFAQCFILGTLAAFSVATLAHGQRVLYVSEHASGTSAGSSWADAYQDLQDAMDDARAAGDIDTEIWIGTGTYKADRGTGDQTLAFELFGSVALYGGFAGSESCRDERDPTLNVTILSGDLNGDDDPDAQALSDCCFTGNPGTCSDAECRATVLASMPECAVRWKEICTGQAISFCCDLCRPTRCDNAYNVLRATERGSAPIVDSVTVLGSDLGDDQGYQGLDQYPSGMYSVESSPRVTRCTFVRNTFGALYTVYGSPAVEDSLFLNNGSEVTGGIALEIDSRLAGVTVRGSSFIDNWGPGLRTWGLDATVRDCKFVGNSVGWFCFSSNCTGVGSQFVSNIAYGMFAYGYTRIIDSLFQGNSYSGLFVEGPALIVNSVFTGNTSGGLGGAVSAAFGNVYVLNSTFFGNSAAHVGGMYVGDGGATIRNSIFWGNRNIGGSEAEGAQFYSNSANIDVDYSIVQGWTGFWGGVGNSGVDPMFVDADGADDIPGTEDDDLRLSPGSPAINSGDPNTSYLPDTDLDGHARVLCGRVDIGAYEFGIGDYNCDQSVELSDFANWASCMTGPSTADTAVPQGCEAFDFNADSTIDLLDFSEWQRLSIVP